MQKHNFAGSRWYSSKKVPSLLLRPIFASPATEVLHSSESTLSFELVCNIALYTTPLGKMIKADKASVLTLAEKCKNILASNWEGYLNTIKADAEGSKAEIYTSKVKYFLRKGKPYIWVPEKDLHNVNAMIDERGSFAISSPFPRPLVKLLRSLKKLPARVALTGDVVPLPDEKIQLAVESLQEMIQSEEQIVKGSSYSVSGLLGSCDQGSTSRSENLKELLDDNKKYIVYRFTPSSCTYIDSNRGKSDLELKDIEAIRAHPLSPYCMSLIDSVNQSDMRRRALVLFCITQLNENAKDAVLLSADRKGFDVLAKVLVPVTKDGSSEYQWKELRISFKDEARNVEQFCQQLVQMEEEALKKVSGSTGLRC